jgi:hypothetical protein
MSKPILLLAKLHLGGTTPSMVMLLKTFPNYALTGFKTLNETTKSLSQILWSLTTPANKIFVSGETNLLDEVQNLCFTNKIYSRDIRLHTRRSFNLDIICVVVRFKKMKNPECSIENCSFQFDTRATIIFRTPAQHLFTLAHGI